MSEPPPVVCSLSSDVLGHCAGSTRSFILCGVLNLFLLFGNFSHVFNSFGSKPSSLPLHSYHPTPFPSPTLCILKKRKENSLSVVSAASMCTSVR